MTNLGPTRTFYNFYNKTFTTDIYNKILHNTEQKKYTCAVFLDLKKAFNTVNPSILLNKLHKEEIYMNYYLTI